MGTITAIERNPQSQRFIVFVDGQRCIGIRPETFAAMALAVGQSITQDELLQRENHHWRRTHRDDAAKRDLARLRRAQAVIEGIDSRLAVEVAGLPHPASGLYQRKPEGAPDLRVRVKGRIMTVLAAEVTGADWLDGPTYWVRPDRLDYARAHPEQEAWLVLHYAQPEEKLVFVRPQRNQPYPAEEVLLESTVERYVRFTDQSVEVLGLAAFRVYLKARLTALLAFTPAVLTAGPAQPT